MRRYSILVTECGADHEVRLCVVDNNPQQTVDGLKAKRLKVYLTPKASVYPTSNDTTASG
jgi:hypothetical protein